MVAVVRHARESPTRRREALLVAGVAPLLEEAVAVGGPAGTPVHAVVGGLGTGRRLSRRLPAARLPPPKRVVAKEGAVPGTTLRGQVGLALVRGTSDTRRPERGRARLVPVAAVLDARVPRATVAARVGHSPTTLLAGPGRASAGRRLPQGPVAGTGGPQGLRVGAGQADGVGQGLAMGAASVGVGLETTDATDPAILAVGKVAKRPVETLAATAMDAGHVARRRAVGRPPATAFPDAPVPVADVAKAAPTPTVADVLVRGLVMGTKAKATARRGLGAVVRLGPPDGPQGPCPTRRPPVGTLRRVGVRLGLGAGRVLPVLVRLHSTKGRASCIFCRSVWLARRYGKTQSEK